MNGIIIDDEHVHEQVLKKTTKPLGIDLSHKDYLEYCAGRTDRACYETISKIFTTSLPVNQLLKDKANFYLKLFPKHKKTYPGVIELIERLSKTYTLALTSSASRAEVNLTAKEYAIDKHFKVTISADEVREGKPDPEPYLITCKLLSDINLFNLIKNDPQRI